MTQQFTATKFMSVKDKELVLKAWKTFLKYGLQRRHFNKRLYEHLTLNCSFIAHFNQQVFYDYYFTSPTYTADFIGQFDHDKGYKSVEHGDSYWITGEYRDVNLAMCNVMDEYKAEMYAKCKQTDFQQDMATVAALMSKHDITNALKVEGGYRFS